MYICKFYKDTENFSPLVEKELMNILDFDIYERLSASRSVGYHLFETAYMIHPCNFSRISYLNLDGIYYVKRYFQKEKPNKNQHKNRLRIVNSKVFVSKLDNQFYEHVRESIFKELENYINIYPASISRSARNMLWYCRRTMRCLNIFEAKRIFLFLMKHMFCLNCQDSALIVDALTTTCKLQYVKEYLVYGEFTIHFLEYILRHCMSIKYNIWRFFVANDDPLFWNLQPFCPVLVTMLTGKYSHLELFLKYGFKRQEYNIALRQLLYERLNVIRLTQSAGVTIKFPSSIKSSCSSDYRRFYLLIETLYLVCRMVMFHLNSQKKWILCAHLLWRSIPDPLISVQEMQMLQNAYKTESATTKRIIRVYQHSFKEISPSVPEPRSLMHLCRCLIRETLQRNYQLPNGIGKLNLPNILVSYLKLQW